MYERKTTLQPFILAIGDSHNHVNYFMVYVDGIIYKFEDAITAVDTLFKLFMVHNIEYPKESFLQQGCYNIFTKYDSNLKKNKVIRKSSVSALIGDLKL